MNPYNRFPSLSPKGLSATSQHVHLLQPTWKATFKLASAHLRGQFYQPIIQNKSAFVCRPCLKGFRTGSSLSVFDITKFEGHNSVKLLITMVLWFDTKRKIKCVFSEFYFGSGKSPFENYSCPPPSRLQLNKSNGRFLVLIKHQRHLFCCLTSTQKKLVVIRYTCRSSKYLHVHLR